MIGFVLWYLVVSFIGLLALPLAYKLLNKLPDRGYAFARPLGLLVWGFVFWILASLHIIQNDAGGVMLALVILAVLGGWVTRQVGWQELIGWIKEQKTTVLTVEILFFAAFAGWAIVRAANPQIVGTEKPMELAFINGILRSPTFPPNDVWLSGYSISYYYFGYVIVSMLIRVSQVESGVGFNLAIALWFGLTAVSAYGILYSLLQFGLKKVVKASATHLWALLGPFFILIVSNIEGFLEILHARGLFWQVGSDGKWYSSFWSWLNILELTDPPQQPLTWVPNRPTGIVWWRASRVIHDFNMSGVGWEVIDEFPFFSYLLGDLHPHVLAMPFVLLAVALALNLFLQGGKAVSQKMTLWACVKKWYNNERVPFDNVGISLWLRSADFWLAAVAIGGLAFLNIWDFPIYVALYCAVNTMTQFEQAGWSGRRIVEFIEQGLTLGIAGVILYLPFYIGFASQAGGILPSLSFFTHGVNFWVMWATLLIPIVLWLIWLWRSGSIKLHFGTGLKFSAGIIGGLWIFSYLLGWLVVGLYQWAKMTSNISGEPEGITRIALNLANLGDMFFNMHGVTSASELMLGSLLRRFESPGTWLTLLALLAVVWAALTGLRKADKKEETDLPPESESLEKPAAEIDRSIPFVLLLVLVGIGLTTVPEFIYLRDQFGDRMNTIFKFYFETWILWGLAAAYASVVLWNRLQNSWKWVFRAAWMALLLTGLAYPIFMTPYKTSNFNPSVRDSNGNLIPDWSLDGALYRKRENSDEWEIIRWLQSAPLGVITEAVGGSYSQYGSISTYSGQPTVIEWPGHEGQWRGGGREMGRREEDIKNLYTTNDWQEAKAILAQYGIRYVYVGPLERGLYKVSEQKFQNNLTVLFKSGESVIYGVPDSDN